MDLEVLPIQYQTSIMQFRIQLTKSVGKFLFYVNLILWLNSGFYLRELARGVDVDTSEFQKEQVKFTVWILLVLILIEIPLWVSVLSAH